MKEIKDKKEAEDMDLKLKTETRKFKIIVFLSIIMTIGVSTLPVKYFTAIITVIGTSMTLVLYMPISNIRKNKKNVILMILSILWVASIFSGSYKLMGVYFLMWSIYIFYLIGILVLPKRNVKLSMFLEQTEKNIDNAFDKNENGKFLLYSAVVPAVSMGLIVLVILIFSMIFLF